MRADTVQKQVYFKTFCWTFDAKKLVPFHGDEAWSEDYKTRPDKQSRVEFNKPLDVRQ